VKEPPVGVSHDGHATQTKAQVLVLPAEYLPLSTRRLQTKCFRRFTRSHRSGTGRNYRYRQFAQLDLNVTAAILTFPPTIMVGTAISPVNQSIFN